MQRHAAGCGGRIRTPDLRVMSPTSCPCSTPRSFFFVTKLVYHIGEALSRVFLKNKQKIFWKFLKKININLCGSKGGFLTKFFLIFALIDLWQHRSKTALRALLRIRLHLFRHFCPKLLEIRRYSCVVLGNLTKKPTARLHDNLCVVLP